MIETVATSFITAAITAFFTIQVRKEKLKEEFALDRDKIRTEFMAEVVARELLESPNWEMRSFAAIQRRLGGFEENELRKILVRAGAVCFEAEDGNELWGLLSRNHGQL